MKSRREETNAIKFQRKMLLAGVTLMEFTNSKLNPFDLELDGWSEAVNDNITDYDEVFQELYEKYKDRAKIAPEIKLMLMLGGSAAMFHFTNTMFRSKMPGMDDILQQNPELARQFQEAAARSMTGGGGGGPARGGGGGGGGGMFGGLGNLMSLFGGGGDDDGATTQAGASVAGEMRGPGDVDDILNELRPEANAANRFENASAVSSAKGSRVRVERGPKGGRTLNVEY